MASDAAVVDKASQNFESENDFGAYRGDEVGKADDTAGVVKVLRDERVCIVAGGCEEARKGVVGDGAVGGKVGLKWVGGEDKLELVDRAGAGKDAGVRIREMVADAGEGLVERMEEAVRRVSSTWTWAIMNPSS